MGSKEKESKPKAPSDANDTVMPPRVPHAVMMRSGASHARPAREMEGRGSRSAWLCSTCAILRMLVTASTEARGQCMAASDCGACLRIMRTSSPLLVGVAYSAPLVAGSDSLASAPALNRSLGSRLRKLPPISCRNAHEPALSAASDPAGSYHPCHRLPVCREGSYGPQGVSKRGFNAESMPNAKIKTGPLC